MIAWELLQATPILDYTHPSIEALIAQRGWKALAESPDAFYARRGVNLSGFKRWLFENIVLTG